MDTQMKDVLIKVCRAALDQYESSAGDVDYAELGEESPNELRKIIALLEV